jgi:phage gpG-like protein
MWGEMREYERTGILAATIANYAGKTLRQGSKQLTPRDFMPVEREEEEEVEPDPAAYFSGLAAGMNNHA